MTRIKKDSKKNKGKRFCIQLRNYQFNQLEVKKRKINSGLSFDFYAVKSSIKSELLDSYVRKTFR